MRLFELLNLQHVVGFFFPTLVFMLVFGIGLAFSHFRSDRGGRTPGHKFVDGLQDGHSPFPLVMMLIITGTFIWAVAYILMYGLTEVKL
jgi:hypothetical protein